MATKQSSKFSILLEFGQSSRVIKTDIRLDEDLLEKELQKVEPNIKLVINKQGLSSNSKEKLIFLQRLSSQWGQYVDVDDVEEIENGDRLKALVYKHPASSCSDVSG